MRKLGGYLLANNRRAAILAFVCALLPLIGLPGDLLTAILVGFITLRKGAKAGLFLLAFVALPTISFLVARPSGLECGVCVAVIAMCFSVVVCTRVAPYVLVAVGDRVGGLIGGVNDSWGCMYLCPM